MWFMGYIIGYLESVLGVWRVFRECFEGFESGIGFSNKTTPAHKEGVAPTLSFQTSKPLTPCGGVSL